ncbi:MAG: hypothetical protein EOM62_20460 [Bacteroidia bacterium]|nr:hypothetical protein [Bacteroidia bacterium]
MESRILGAVDNLRLENECLQADANNLREALVRSTEELSVLRQEMKQIIEGLDWYISAEGIESVAEQTGEDFDGAFECTIPERTEKMNGLKVALWDMMKIVMENRVALGYDCPVM